MKLMIKYISQLCPRNPHPLFHTKVPQSLPCLPCTKLDKGGLYRQALLFTGRLSQLQEHVVWSGQLIITGTSQASTIHNLPTKCSSITRECNALWGSLKEQLKSVVAFLQLLKTVSLPRTCPLSQYQDCENGRGLKCTQTVIIAQPSLHWGFKLVSKWFQIGLGQL